MDNDLNLTIAQVIKKYRLLNNKSRAKSFGQHFLCDSSLLKKIVACALPFGENDILEIGPGPCGLTRAILDFAENQRIICIEKDRTLKPLHDNLIQHSGANLEFIYEDALKVRLCNLSIEKVKVISNLPYNVGTKILLNLLQELDKIESMILMFQKEVADRICAKPGSKDYGRLSIISQILCDCEKCFDVSNMAFFPPPDVQSTVIRLTPKAMFPIDITNLEKLTAICFQNRRKTISTILKRALPMFTTNILDVCEIEPSMRPETISVEKFLKLSKYLNFSKKPY